MAAPTLSSLISTVKRSYPGDNNGESKKDDGGGNSFTLATGGLVVIIILVAVVAIVGVTTATLFYIARKREWTLKETVRRSTRKVVRAMTPRRAHFPDSVKEPRPAKKSRVGRVRIADDEPRISRLGSGDLEKGLAMVDIESKDDKNGAKYKA